jgi:hypothetical protein
MRWLLGGGLVAAVLACSPSTAAVGGSGGGQAGGGAAGGRSAGGGNGGGAGGGQGAGVSDGGDGCPDAAKVVYVVDADLTFSSFDPKTQTFTDLGALDCPAKGGAVPFSMAVSRDAFAYVLYDDGELFKVSTATLDCTATAFAQSDGFTQFGMGFSTDLAGGAVDTLFVAGGQAIGAQASLGTLDLGTFNAVPVGTIGGWPELTGTGDAKLWGFFPDLSGGTPYVAQIDKATAHLGTTYMAGILGGDPDAWAFAFWGGDFWVFLKLATDDSTNVWKMDAATGGVSPALTSTGRTIVGAGVSTCAPVTIN